MIIFFMIILTVGIIALFIAVYPLHKSPKLAMAIPPLFLSALYFGYSHWGNFKQWQQYLDTSKKQAIVKKWLQDPDATGILVNKLKAQLQKSPKSSKGWYLLGRLSASRGDWQAAVEAFARAFQLKPQDEVITVNYAESLWQNNNQQFTQQIRNLFEKVLKKNPQQPNALAMLAMDYYVQKNYKLAIVYWERLLRFAPSQSEEAAALRQAIAKAHIMEKE